VPGKAQLQGQHFNPWFLTKKKITDNISLTANFLNFIFPSFWMSNNKKWYKVQKSARKKLRWKGVIHIRLGGRKHRADDDYRFMQQICATVSCSKPVIMKVCLKQRAYQS